MQSNDVSALNDDPLGKRYWVDGPHWNAWSCFLAIGALFMIGAMIALGLWLYLVFASFPFKGEEWFSVVGAIILPILLFALGFVFVRNLRGLTTSTELREKGFRLNASGSSEDVRWVDVEVIQQVTTFHADSMLTRVYKVKLRNGKEYRFEGGDLGKVLFELAHQASIRWEKIEENG